MNKSPDFSYINGKGNVVRGAAAFNHHVYTECGGIAKYNDKVGEAYIKAFVQAQSASINQALTKTARKNRFRKIG